MRVEPADVRERLDLRQLVEDVQAVTTEEREVASARKTVPELFELDRSVSLAPLTEDVDHLPEGVDSAPGEAC